MTEAQFLARHGANFSVLRREPLFLDLIETVRSFDPARSIPGVSAKDATENAEHLLGRIAGFNLALNILTNGLQPVEELVDIEARFQEEPI